jgi:predicted dehydrogenase
VRHLRDQNVELTAIADIDERRARRAAEEFGARHWYTDYRALLARDDVQVVSLCLPHHLHRDVAIDAARAGKHVLCEKPLVLGGRELAEVDEAVGAAGVQLTEAFMYRHHPQQARVRDLLASGDVGDLVAVHARLHFVLPRTPDPDIRLRPDMGGGSLLDLGCYPIDLFGALTGREPDDVVATAVRDEPGGVDTRTAAALRYGDVLATLDCSFDAPMTHSATLVCTRGVITMQGAFRADLTGGVATLLVERDGATQRIEVQGDQYAEQIRAFTDSLRDRAAGSGDAELSRRTARTLERVARAAGLA